VPEITRNALNSAVNYVEKMLSLLQLLCTFQLRIFLYAPYISVVKVVNSVNNEQSHVMTELQVESTSVFVELILCIK